MSNNLDLAKHQLPFHEKIGYALGDAASNLVWRGALAYMAVFYTDVFGISAIAASLLLLLVRLSDGVTDIMIGMIADRTETRWGKFRPWILWSTPFLGLFMVLSFTTPNLSPEGKLVWAYVTYIGLTLAYTVSNVPYSALMGVMTANPTERNILSGWRFAGAFLGGALIMGFLPAIVSLLGNGDEQQGYQYAMFLFAGLLVVLFLITFMTTRERVKPPIDVTLNLKAQLVDFSKNLPFILLPLVAITLFFYYRDIYTGLFFLFVIGITYYLAKRLIKRGSENLSHTQQDLVDLITNKPWWILLAIGFLFMMFNGIKMGTIIYYFKYYTGNEILAGAYFIALLVISIIAALSAGYICKFVSKKALFINALFFGGLTTGTLYFLEPDQVKLLFFIGCLSEVFAAFMPVLFFSMLGDAADFSEWKNHRRATGLFYSAGTFINKTGGGFAGALILLVLASYGYDGMDATTVEQSLPGIKLLMSWVPAAFSFIAAGIMLFYPLTEDAMMQIESDLLARRTK
ncbi:MFS transporter [Aliikangiella marina]|uniref:MFS transporter n=1 Tax=Aliikangiella marina TaxID=1712262 RepID=A0A545T185_9GAMM|nr:MFS transporter [Aliikangiella marina]TQV70970.1 MFS transporter [Aliikangiella marina]